jgi:hypothetical protein
MSERAQIVDVAERVDLIEDFFRNPPSVHNAAATGVWSTAASAYQFMASVCTPGTRTLETGLGISTALFAAWQTEHICVVPSQNEVDALVGYLDQRGIASDGVRFEVGFSDDILPTLDLPELDLVFIDGGHSFPTPIIDWYYGAKALRAGGTLVLDDTYLRSVTMGLADYLDADPRWERLDRTQKWLAYKRLSSGPLREVQEAQDFLSHGLLPRAEALVPSFARPVAKKVAERLHFI